MEKQTNSLEHRRNHITYGHMNMIHDFKKLWTELTIWQRTLIGSMAASFGDRDLINQRLYRITSEFKNKLQMFYGKVLPERLEFLLIKHLVIAEGVITALKDGNQEAADQGISDWYKNCDEMARYMSLINPYWNEAEWRNLLRQYVKMTVEETIALFSGAYEKDIEIFDRMSHHSSILGDYMANGVIQQITERPRQSWHFLRIDR